MVKFMDAGSRDDPQWAWYWEEVEKEAALDAAGRKDVVTSPIPLLLLTERVEARYAPPAPYSSPIRRDFRRIVRWIPLIEREIITFAYTTGKPRGSSLWSSFNQKHRSCEGDVPVTQQTWSTGLKRAEEWVVHLAGTYRECAPKNTLRGALKRVEWPDVLTAYVDAGSTAKASRTAACAQDVALAIFCSYILMSRLAASPCGRPISTNCLILDWFSSFHSRIRSRADNPPLMCSPLMKV